MVRISHHRFLFSELVCGYNSANPMMRFLSVLLFAFCLPITAQQEQPGNTVSPQAILEHAKAASVIVLSGEGGGRLHSIATGVIISKDGIILTALHAVKGALEVQVRLADGDVFDRVELLGTDERRDIAELKISAGGLPALQPASTAPVMGDPVYAVTNADGLAWSATEGIVSAIRPASEITGAGSGFHLLQFTAPVAPGSSGGALVGRTGALIGIITSGKGNAGFAVPIESVMGLSDSSRPVFLGSGAALQLPATTAALVPQSSAAIADAKPNQIIKNAKTIYIRSKTSFLTVDTLDRALIRQKDWSELGLTIVQDPRVADLFIEIDRPIFTYVHTFVIVDKKTSIVLASGKVTAFDGTIASGGLAKDIVKTFAVLRLPSSQKK